MNENFVNYVGIQEIEFIMCVTEQFPEKREFYSKFLLNKLIEYAITKAMIEVCDE